MASSDPRKIRPVGQAPEPTSYDAEEDPLVELARIVSEDGGFSGRRAEKAKPLHEAQNIRSAFSADLEAELLQELESSFAERQAPPQPPAPRAAPSPAPAPRVAPPPTPAAIVEPLPTSRVSQPQRPPVTPLRPEPVLLEEPELSDTDADDLLRSIEEQLGQFERRAQASRVAAVEDELGTAFDAPVHALDPTPDPADEWRPRRSAPVTSGEDEIAATPSSRRQAPPAVIAAGHADYRFRGPAGDHGRARILDDEAGGQQPFARPRQEGPVGEASRGRDRIERAGSTNEIAAPVSGDFDPAEAFVARNQQKPRFAAEGFRREGRGTEAEAVQSLPDPIEAGFADVEAEISRQLEPRYADPSFVGRRRQAPANDAGEPRHTDPSLSGRRPPAPVKDADEPRVAAVAAAREQIGRPAGRNAVRKQQRGGSRKGVLMAASVVIVAAAGAAAAMYLRAGEQAPAGPPPVIAAPEGAVKVEPRGEQAAAEGETVGEAVYNRVAGTATDDTEEQVVDSSEEPREIARIVLPDQADTDGAMVRQVGEEDAAAPAAAEAQAPSESSGDEIGPRRVQTFVVRPDGTIVTTDEAGTVPDPAAGQQEQLAAQTEQIEPVPVATVAIGASSASAEAAGPAEPAAAPAGASGSEPAQALAALRPSEPPAPEPAEGPAAAPAEPAEALAAAPATLPEVSATGDGYVVQVSSQRSREQAEASFADMQRRYDSVLGNLNASVQEANLGEKGIYYRVRVGPWATREEALGVCEALQGAGGTCFVTQ